MAEYDYYAAVRKDVKRYILTHDLTVVEYGLDSYKYDLWEDMDGSDEVTGAHSGTYTHDRKVAESNLEHNWELVAKDLEDCGQEVDAFRCLRDPEYADTIARREVLQYVCDDVVDELVAKGVILVKE